MRKKINSVDRLLEVSSLSVNNTLNDQEVQQRMTQHGFTPKRMQEGKTLLEQFTQLCEHQEQRYEERWELANRMDRELQTTRALFVEHVEIVRFVFRQESAILNKLSIQRIEQARWKWVKQSHRFYTKALEHADQLALHGLTQEELAQAKASLEAILAMREELVRKKGAAEDTTQRKSQANQNLRVWLSDFRTVARMAFKESPQKLEAFGIRVRSGK